MMDSDVIFKEGDTVMYTGQADNLPQGTIGTFVLLDDRCEYTGWKIPNQPGIKLANGNMFFVEQEKLRLIKPC